MAKKSKRGWKVGEKYFIRLVTHHDVGRLVAFDDKELILEDAAWVASDGRFANALKEGVLDEVEPFPDGEVIIGRGAIIDACVWRHELPRVQK